MQALIDTLLSFPVDYSNWTDADLKTIGIFGRPSLYPNIPTGLFVAGFLANISLMEIDNIVQEKLERKRNIAHFRYVDDHVILGKSFEDIITWIDEYAKLLADKDTGAVFNYEKTEPESLADYFKLSKDAGEQGKEGYKEKTDGLKDKAKKEMLLDPDFPSPLMTQTLTKVSKLAQTTFELLTPQEETSLIADVEHLLITEFPDQEVRRDTRVSFAARMLSSLVPELTINIEELYSAKKELTDQTAFLNKKQEELQTAHEVKKQGLNANVESIKNGIKNIEIKITSIDKDIAASDKKIGARTLKLLLKAVRENHEKIRLWTRVLEFCLRMGISNILDILKEVKGLNDKGDTNTLSCRFIYSLILQILSNLVLQSFAILESDTFSYKRKKRAEVFLQSVFAKDFFDYWKDISNKESLRFEKTSMDVFKFTAGTVIHLLNEKFPGKYGKFTTLVKKYNLISWEKGTLIFCKRTGYEFAQWAWWILGRLPKRKFGEVPYLWNEIQFRLKVTEQIDQNIIQLYPHFLSDTILEQIDVIGKILKLASNEGFLFELEKGMSGGKAGKKFAFLESISSKVKKIKGRITICDWIDWARERQLKMEVPVEGQLIFDPRLSEWAALEITSWIISIVIGKVEDIPFEAYFEPSDYSKWIHPNNFILPEKIISEGHTLSWENLRALFASAEPDLAFRPENELIFDERFVATSDLGSSSKIESSITSICSLLICLLAKDYNLPPKWNPIGHQMAWLGLYKTKLKDVAISSFTRNIIDGCFSSKNKESRLYKTMLGGLEYVPADDTINDPPAFYNLKELLSYIKKSQSYLVRQQISVSEHQPRQLIPVNLKMFKRSNYQDEHQIEGN